MHVELTACEALRLAGAGGPLPPVVRGVRADGDAVTVELDGRTTPGLTGAAHLAASLVGVVPVEVRPLGVTDGVATFALAVRVRGVPVHGLLRALQGLVDERLAQRGLPAGTVRLSRTEQGAVAVVALDALVRRAVVGLAVVGLALRDGVVRLDLAVGPEVRRA